MTSKPAFLWCDLETTGLNAQKDCILEIAMVVTDVSFTELDRYERVLHFPRHQIERLDPFIQKMHTENGLLEICDSIRAKPTEAISAELVNFIQRFWPDPKDKPILAGNSIHFDRGFIKAWFPIFDKMLHYRMLDVSAVKIMVQTWGHKSMEFPKVDPPPHRALADIRASIAEMKHYVHHALKDLRE